MILSRNVNNKKIRKIEFERGTFEFPHCKHFLFQKNFSLIHLTTIGGCWYFDRAFVPQRLKNQSLYHEIVLYKNAMTSWARSEKNLLFIHIILFGMGVSIVHDSEPKA